MTPLTTQLARLHRSVAARFSGLTAKPVSKPQPRMEGLEERLLLSATLLVDAGADQVADEGSQISVTGTYEDLEGGGGTPGVFDVLQLTSTSASEQQLDIDGNRAVWESDGEILYFDGTTDALNNPNIINITGNTTIFESDPHISGDYIVYAGAGINAYDIVNGTTISLASAGVTVANPEIDGNIAVWTQRVGSFYTVMMADLSAATVTPTAIYPLGSGPGANGSQLDPKISGDNVVWESPGVGGYNDVFMYNLTNDTIVNVSNSSTEDDGHEISDGVVVWYTDGDVYYYDSTAASPAAVNIGSAGVSDVVPKVSGRNIVWDGNADVYWHNIDTAVTVNLTNAPAPFLTTPDISGNNIIWSGYTDVYLYNIDTAITTNISSSSQLDTQPLVSGDNVVWLSRATSTSQNDVFFASGTSEPLTYTIDWDFGDGTVITDTTLEQDHTYLDNGLYTVTLTVTASDGRVTTDTLTADIANVAPIVDPIVGDTQALRGSTLSFTGSYSDPGVLDTHTTEWTVTDSGGAVVATGTGSTFDFTPEDAGTFDVTFTVTDNDGGFGSSTLSTSSVVILVGPDPLDPSQTTIQIAGSNGRDIIRVRKSCWTPGTLKVIVHELDTGNVYIEDGIVGADRVIADGRAGNDQIKVRCNLGDLKAELYGSDGNDMLCGGDANDFISGGDGCDLISGGNGRDFLVGGLGSDLVLGNNQDDILVGGVYVEGRDLAAERAILAEWSRTDLGYVGRINNIINGTGLNGSSVLDETNVFDDNSFDILLGLQGRDWFHANDCQDLTDERRNEYMSETEIDFVDADVDYIV